MTPLQFIEESNRIEGITGTTPEEAKEFRRFMDLDEITVADLEKFVSIYQPNAKLRVEFGMNVRVGGYYPPTAGPDIRIALIELLKDIQHGQLTPFDAHVRYESLHPFSDGNGRSGRMLWAWQMGKGGLELGFLHAFYYQTLESQQRAW
jgi:hypothetical protein